LAVLRLRFLFRAAQKRTPLQPFYSLTKK